jgi:predicted hotdog family 3-hydroxylacyl-ACP dehydratase
MLERSAWAHLIPHAGAMCLLDAVVAWDDAGIHAISTSHGRADHPLRGPHGLHAVHLAEYGAQAGAVHGALLARDHGADKARPGWLVSLRDLVLAVEYVDDASGRLDVHAQCLSADTGSAQYAFRVEGDGRVLVSGRAAVIHPDPEQTP